MHSAIVPQEAARETLRRLAQAIDAEAERPDIADSTRRAYTHDIWDFADFCGRFELVTMPAEPQTVALYLKQLQERGLAISSLRRRLAAISLNHATHHHESPTHHPLIGRMLRSYTRIKGTAVQKKTALLIENLPALLMAMPEDLAAARDRALLLLGYAGAFRRAELVALDLEHLRFSKNGLYVWIAAAKNDQTKKGRDLYVPRLPGHELCAVRALEQWLERAQIGEGALYRTFDLRGRLTEHRLDSGDVARILKRRALAAGVSGNFAGHSLRRGFITNAAKRKVPIESIKRVTGQRSNTIVLGYVAAATVDDDPPLLDIIRVVPPH